SQGGGSRDGGSPPTHAIQLGGKSEGPRQPSSEGVVLRESIGQCPEQAPRPIGGVAAEHFGLTLFLWAIPVAYFFGHRFLWVSCYKKRRPNFVSATLGFAMLGWPMAILRDMHWMSYGVAVLLYAGAFIAALLINLSIAGNEAQRKHPFSADD